MWNSEEDERIPQKSFQKSLIKTRVYLNFILLYPREMPRGSLSLLNLSRCEVVRRKIMMTSSSIDGIRNKGVLMSEFKCLKWRQYSEVN